MCNILTTQSDSTARHTYQFNLNPSKTSPHIFMSTHEPEGLTSFVKTTIQSKKTPKQCAYEHELEQWSMPTHSNRRNL